MNTISDKGSRAAVWGYLAALAVAACAVLVAVNLTGCSHRSTAEDEPLAAPANDDPAGETECFSCGLLNVAFGPNVPGDAPITSDQLDADCFAWWEFITLNWPTKQGAGFGDPGDQDPIQWQTYMVSSLLFQPGAKQPPPWGTQPAIPANCQSQANLAAEDGVHRHLFSATGKFTTSFAEEFDFPDSIDEAAPTNAPNWLGAQNSTNVWYEIRVNQDEFDYVVDPEHQFYNADKQAAWTAANKAINLPKGSANGKTGAIELKAAWMEVPDPQDAKWQRYKLSSAVVVDPNTNSCRTTTVALVGLHIIHKTETQPTWFWATFEHVDNVPGPNSQGPYNFNNPNCKPQQVDVPQDCLPKGSTSPVTVTCTSNTSPPYYLCQGGPGPVPIQVTRVVPIDDNAQQANTTAQAAIKQNYPNSVWQYYQLINVIWSTNPSQDSETPVKVPKPLRSMQPTQKVANTTLETYAQNLTCTDCHQYATIAPTKSDPQPQWSSDFSFLLGSASSPSDADESAEESSACCAGSIGRP